MPDSIQEDDGLGSDSVAKMFGQWIGTTTVQGTETHNTLNIEKRSRGTAQILAVSLANPQLRICTTAPFQENGDIVTIESPVVQVFDADKGVLVPVQDYCKQHNTQLPIAKKTVYTVQSRGRVLAATFVNDLGIEGSFNIVNTVKDPAAKAKHTLTWENFKDFVSQFNPETVIYRGQPDSIDKLRTTFHRHQRNNLVRYVDEDVPKLRHAVNAVGSFYYPPIDPEHFGGLLSLAQHHGYPTPLLDWTYSPYIAAFFAFTEPVQKARSATAARIFIFDYANWPSQPSANLVIDPLPTIQFLVLSAHNNPRFVPQQSIASFSNVDDMEYWVRKIENESNRQHLTIVDIPVAEKRKAIDELRLMGITAGSLFPGIDGLCRSLKERYFRNE